jgi:hypothetical protein
MHSWLIPYVTHFGNYSVTALNGQVMSQYTEWCNAVALTYDNSGCPCGQGSPVARAAQAAQSSGWQPGQSLGHAD